MTTKPNTFSRRLARCGLLVPALVAALLAGCDSDDPTPAVMMQGVVADGYLVGARVCLDVNDNFACDAGEPRAVTVAGGAWQFAVIPGQENAHAVLVDVPATAVDEDTGVAVGTAYRMAAPAGRHAVVNPLTTLLVEQMRAYRQSDTAAAAVLAATLGVSDPATLFADYAQAGATTEQRLLHNVARVLARGLAGGDAEFTTAFGGAIPSANARESFAAVVDNLRRN